MRAIIMHATASRLNGPVRKPPSRSLRPLVGILWKLRAAPYRV